MGAFAWGKRDPFNWGNSIKTVWTVRRAKIISSSNLLRNSGNSRIWRPSLMGKRLEKKNINVWLVSSPCGNVKAALIWLAMFHESTKLAAKSLEHFLGNVLSDVITHFMDLNCWWAACQNVRCQLCNWTINAKWRYKLCESNRNNKHVTIQICFTARPMQDQLWDGPVAQATLYC